jgi:hypothetical protein
MRLLVDYFGTCLPLRRLTVMGGIKPSIWHKRMRRALWRSDFVLSFSQETDLLITFQNHLCYHNYLSPTLLILSFLLQPFGRGMMLIDVKVESQYKDMGASRLMYRFSRLGYRSHSSYSSHM